ncbi:MAG: NAD-dependent epimerase/dehydratase family protein [Candidatus Bathycorpusculaceae bacterium]
MKVLVTGVTGFIGNTLSSELVRRGYDVHGLARFTSKQWLVPEGVNVHVGDLTDVYSLNRIVKTVNPEIVFHLGAATPVSESFNQPRLYMETNYHGTVNLAEACRNVESLRAFVYASTSETYGVQTVFPISETAECKPDTPYAINKYAAELYLKNYLWQAYDFPVVIAKPFNTFGRANVNQPHFVVEKIITSILKGKQKIYLGEPKVERDFMFRFDHVNGYLHILKAVEKGKHILGEVFNFSTGKSVSIEELTEKIKSLIGWDGKIVWGWFNRPIDIPKLEGDYSKAKRVLGWAPKYDLERGLKEATREWKEKLQ